MSKIRQLKLNKYFRMGIQIVFFLSLAMSLFNLFQSLSTTVVNNDVANERNFFSITAIISLIMLIVFTEFTIEDKSHKNSVNIINIKKKYGKKIADAIELPSSKDKIQIATIKDLVIIAGELSKPILHVGDSVNHWFFVLDGQTMYETRIIEVDVNT